MRSERRSDFGHATALPGASAGVDTVALNIPICLVSVLFNRTAEGFIMTIELSRFFGVNGYMPHGYCLSWSEPLVLTYVVSDTLIFLAYFSMPAALAYFARKRKDFPYPWLLWMFAAFIMSCGATHLMGAIVLWLPLYGLDALLKAATAIISVITAVMLWPMIPQALKLPSHEQLRLVNEKLQTEILARKRVENTLRLGKNAAEQSLKKEQMLMAAIVESSEDAIISKTLDGIITHWNRAAEKIFGYLAAEIVGKSMLILIPSELLDEEKRMADSILLGESVKQLDTVRICKDGSRVTVSVTVSPIRNQEGRIIGASKIARDISEKKRNEKTLRKFQAQLKSFIQAAPSSIAMFDQDMIYLAASGSWLAEYGRGYADLTGRNHYRVHPDLPDEWKRIHQQGLAGATLKNDEDLWIQADGNKRWLRWTVLPWTNELGKIGGIIISTEDITDRKLAEEKIRHLNVYLEQRVIERTAELTAANSELDSFAYAVSHDLRAPLRAMSGFSQALTEDYGGMLQGEAKLYLEQIDLASRKMNELVDGLLVLSRSTRGELQHDAVDLSALSELVLAELRQTDPGRQVAAQVESGLLAHGDSRMIEAVMRNLLGNAWKYTAHAAEPVIRVYSEEQNGERRFCVADNGAGFDMAHANRLFQPFQRLHRQDEFPGIGIGLATVQRIVHRHGGIIEAQGEPGKGAVFCFTLFGAPTNNETQL